MRNDLRLCCIRCSLKCVMCIVPVSQTIVFHAGRRMNVNIVCYLSGVKHALDKDTVVYRDLCFDGLKTDGLKGEPVQGIVMILTNDTYFANRFSQRCTGHAVPHSQRECTAVQFPRAFFHRAVSLWRQQLPNLTPSLTSAFFSHSDEVVDPVVNPPDVPIPEEGTPLQFREKLT